MELSQRIVLASSSPWRRKMLQDAGVVCDAVASGLDESRFQADSPKALALLLAREKAKQVHLQNPGAITIGADQVAFNEEGSFGKPRDPADHLERLMSLCGRTHWLTTGVVFVGAASDTQPSRTPPHLVWGGRGRSARKA
ncbi:MAG: Maf family protein, partial [Myxococcota bacterium]|nr:Maf family protein [Myxococcota bacterium]